jgi:TonB family protein
MWVGRGSGWARACVASAGAHALAAWSCVAIAGLHRPLVSGAAHDSDAAPIAVDLLPPRADPEPEAPPPARVQGRSDVTAMARRRPAPRPPRGHHLALPTPEPAIAPPGAPTDDETVAFTDDAGSPEPAAPPPPAPAPEPAAPPLVPSSEASYLRTYETFPGLPGNLQRRGSVYHVLVKVCVAADGRVHDVTVAQGGALDLDRVLVTAVRTWRYRPRLVAGTPAPFCHLMGFEYSMR